MNEAAKNSKNIYRMEYQLEVPVSAGLKPLFQQIEEIRSELGIKPSDDDFCVLYSDTGGKELDYYIKALVNYSQKDARSVLAGNMSEDEYILRHIRTSKDTNGNVLTDTNGGLDNFAVEDIF